MNRKKEIGKQIEEIRSLCNGRWDDIPSSMYNDIARGTVNYWGGRYDEAEELLRIPLRFARQLYGDDTK